MASRPHIPKIGEETEMKARFKVGDIIFWYCDREQRVHKAQVEFVNYAGVGFPDTNYEVHTICCGEKRTVFVDENDAMEKVF